MDWRRFLRGPKPAAPPPPDIERMKRRHRQDVKVARARGLMTGICTLLRPGDVVVDCGANVGDITQRLSSRGATVHAFEPDPYSFAKLTERFGSRPNVTLHQAAVGAEAGQLQLMRAVNFEADPKKASVSSTIVKGGVNIDEQAGSAINVEVVDLPAFLRGLLATHSEIAFLKLDIEGAELDLLEAMEGTDLFKSIRLTVVETHEHKFPALRPRYAALRKRMAEPAFRSRVFLDWI